MSNIFSQLRKNCVKYFYENCVKYFVKMCHYCVKGFYNFLQSKSFPAYLSLHLGCEGILENSLALGVVHLVLALVTFNVK